MPTFISEPTVPIFHFCLPGSSVQQGLRHALGLYVWAYSAKDGFSAFDFADQLDRLGDRTVITVSRDLYKVWVEVKSSTCPSWNIINTAALARAQVA